MPPVRTQKKSRTVEATSLVLNLSAFKFGEAAASAQKCARGRSALGHRVENVKPIDLALQSDDIYFPTSEAERVLFKTKEGKKVTPHQWAVYDVTRKIPCGKVMTYKSLCTLLGEGSPRSIGNALRRNPFAPFVPCHRIVSSDLKLGGFYGEWGTEGQEGSKCHKKVNMLEQEGVFFSDEGVLTNKDSMLWSVKDM